MAKCIKLKRTKTEVCIGSLDKKIQIYTRDLTTPLDPTGTFTNYNENFTLLYDVWAMIQTPKAKTTFDSIGEEKVVTHIFYIRYLPLVTSEKWIIYDGNRYDIQTVENIEENKLFLQINCIFRGLEQLDASKA